MILPYFTVRIALFVREADGYPRLPANVTSGPVYDDAQPSLIGGLPSREFRHASGNCIVLQRVAPVVLPDTRNGAIVLAWIPSNARLGPVPQRAVDLFQDLVAAGTVIKSWVVVDDGTGALVSNALEADVGVAATLVKANWPIDWRKRLAGDSLGDPFAVPAVPPSPPTGVRMIGAAVA